MDRHYPFYTDSCGVIRRYPRCIGQHGYPCICNAGHEGWHWTILDHPFLRTRATIYNNHIIFGPRIDRRTRVET